MNVSDLEHLESFALHGPGFGGGGLTLLGGLRATSAPDGPYRLVYVPFERSGANAFLLAADEMSEVTMSVGGTPRAGRIELRAGRYHEAIAAIREAIAAGDVYQVCHTVRAAVSGVRGSDLVTVMARLGLPRFLSWVRLPWGEEFVSASPELFFEIEGRRIRTEPMKGTARPGAHESLESSDKDRAELAMITDLLRNDLTTVCRPRSVEVACERRQVVLPYAVQTVSEIVGELQANVTVLGVLAALHPGGSVTGAPKKAALAMIGRLEPEPRGPYCGTLGLVGGERAVFSLLIRTAVRSTAEEWIYGVGGGIVYDSNADAEMEELRVKLGSLTWDTRS